MRRANKSNSSAWKSRRTRTSSPPNVAPLPREAGRRTVTLRVVPGHDIAPGELDMKMMTLGLASLLVLGVSLAYGEDKKDDNKTKVVGVWEVVEGDAPK